LHKLANMIFIPLIAVAVTAEDRATLRSWLAAGKTERRLTASMTDRLSTLYEDLLVGSYDCVDRIVLNGYFRIGHSAGGPRAWWRALTGQMRHSTMPT
jgi:hypothetical protein